MRLKTYLAILLINFFYPQCLLAAPAPAGAEALSFTEASALLQERSPKLKASSANVESQVYQHRAVKGLGRPNLFLTSIWGYYDLQFDINLQRFQELGMDLGNDILHNNRDYLRRNTPLFYRPLLNDPPDLVPGNSYEMKLKGHFDNKSLLLVWPVYTGGLIGAVKDLSHAKVEEARAEDGRTTVTTHATLVERYFGAQLLRQVKSVRQNAMRAIEHHDYTAKRMLEEGLISKVERMQATVALEDAKRNLEKARNDSELANLSLKSLLKSEERITPTTPLFVSRKPLNAPQYFIDLALANHPGLSLVRAKEEEARAVARASASRWKPNIAVVGAGEISGHHPNRMIGVNLSFTLFSSVSRAKMQKSAEQKVRQAELTEEEARDNIVLLVKKNYNEVEDARGRFHALASNVKLAEEYLRLRRLGLKEGVNTVSDLIDAEVNYEKAQTEQLSAAYEYIIALNNLVSDTGKPELFEEFLREADVRLR